LFKIAIIVKSYNNVICDYFKKISILIKNNQNNHYFD